MSKLDFLNNEIQALKEQGLFINIRTIESAVGAWIQVDGKRVLNLCTNNYLGFANHPKLKEAAKKAIDEYGVGPAAVRSIAGTQTLHRQLEQKLAAFKGVEDTISVQSGLLANQAVIPTITTADDVIISDELNHASIIDGTRLSKAKVVRYKHNDVADLEAKLKSEPVMRNRLIITDGVFSMDGDVAPMKEIVEIAEKYDALTMADDAHGEGVLGRAGRGIADHFGLHGRVDIEIGTLSKAFGVVGGYIAGKKAIVDYLRQRARPFLFSSAVTPADIAACIAAVDILAESGELVEKLWANTKYFKNKMRALSFDLGQSVTPITPVMIGDTHKARALSQKLFENGVFTMAIGFPTVAKGKERLRVMISATHSTEDLDFAVKAFEKVGKEVGVI
jgi:glycine C-acetyltransferase